MAYRISNVPVDWEDLISVTGHAILYANWLRRDFIVYENTMTGVFGMALADQTAMIKEKLYKIRMRVNCRSVSDDYLVSFDTRH